MRRYSDQPTVNIQLVWNPNTVRGFIGAVIIAAVVLSLGQCADIQSTSEIYVPRPAPIVLLRLGEGDGTGASKGNLSAEGAAQKGNEASNPLVDAQRSSGNSSTSSSDPTQSGKLIAVRESGKGNAKSNEASAENTVGKSYGSEDGTGLDRAGSGSGSGKGFGDIDWGGGGGRIVETKVLPDFPPGALDTKVTIEFTVAPDGTVISARAKTKSGNSSIEMAAITAIRRWRFNKLPTNVVMQGVITFRVNYK